MSGWKLWLLVAAFAASIVFTGVFGFRAARHHHHLKTDEVIRPWMSIPYVAHSYHVPAKVLFDALGIPYNPHDRRPIRQVARELSRPVDSVIADLMNAIDQARESQAPAGSPSPSSAPSAPPPHPRGTAG